MGDTPLTDEVYEKWCIGKAGSLAAWGLARDLERQLAEKQAEIEAMYPMLEGCKARRSTENDDADYQ